MTQETTEAVGRLVQGTVAEGFEAVREEFAAFVTGELSDYRRRYAFPGGAAPENERFVRAVHGAALCT